MSISLSTILQPIHLSNRFCFVSRWLRAIRCRRRQSAQITTLPFGSVAALMAASGGFNSSTGASAVRCLGGGGTTGSPPDSVVVPPGILTSGSFLLAGCCAGGGSVARWLWRTVHHRGEMTRNMARDLTTLQGPLAATGRKTTTWRALVVDGGGEWAEVGG
jgi:hypothetical protein